MKLTRFFLFLVFVGMTSCNKEVLQPGTLCVNAFGGTYAGTDIFCQYFMATGLDTTDTVPASVRISIDPSGPNRIVIGTDTFMLLPDSSFVTIHPSSDPHVFNRGSFRTDAQHHTYLRWQKGSAYLSSGYYHVVECSR